MLCCDLYIGCAGWGLPPEARDCALSYLERYAQIFNCSEINSCFYRHHRPATYAKWAEVVPEEFRFSAKIPKAVTHEDLGNTGELERFLDEVGELREKLGALLMQFPASLRFNFELVERFLVALRTRNQSRIVCEPRHSSWFSQPALRLLERYRIDLVAADPAAAPQARILAEDERRYYRLHGTPRTYYSAYDEQFLEFLAGRAAKLRKRGEVWVVFDNTASGAAYYDAVRFQSMSDRLAAEGIPLARA